jgi:hypothetical protein
MPKQVLKEPSISWQTPENIRKWIGEPSANSKGVSDMTMDFKWLTRTACLLMAATQSAAAQSAPASPDRPWYSSAERKLVLDGHKSIPAVPINPEKVYSLAHAGRFRSAECIRRFAPQTGTGGAPGTIGAPIPLVRCVDAPH